MALSKSTLEFLHQNFSKDIQVHFDPNWGSQNPQHRTLLKAQLNSALSNSQLYSSISHCPGMGVFLTSPHPVGVDVEVRHRVEPRVLARVSSPEELKAASTHPASLWCAKEAAFKALKNFNQPSVISKISIGDWKNIDSQTETYRLLNSESHSAPSENRGVILHIAEFTFSFFIFPS